MSNSDDQLQQTVAALERRLAALEERVGTPPIGSTATSTDLPPAPAGTWWLLEELGGRSGPGFERDGVAGSVAYGGRTTTSGAGQVAWQMEHPLPDLLDADWTGAAGVLSALGHPLRLEIVRRLLQGARTMHDLQQIATLGTTGQLQHHLRELRTAGIVEQPRRNDYAVAVDRVVPCLVMIAAATGPTRSVHD